MSKVVVFDHPLIQHKLSIMRDKNTGTKEFRELLSEIAMLMVFEVTRDLETMEVEVETPLTTCKCRVLSGKKLGIVPILRAGLGMVDGVINLVPAARVGHIGLYRDPRTLEPIPKKEPEYVQQSIEDLLDEKDKEEKENAEKAEGSKEEKEEKKADPEEIKKQEEQAIRLQQQSEAFRSRRNGKRRR